MRTGRLPASVHEDTREDEEGAGKREQSRILNEPRDLERASRPQQHKQGGFERAGSAEAMPKTITSYYCSGNSYFKHVGFQNL